MADYAVVVGVAHYPELSANGGPADLAGPNNDAQDVQAWLVDPAGGALDPGNVRLVCSSEFSPADPQDPQPATARIERELRWVEQQTRTTPGGRLYLYFSGHGFSPVLEEGALFTAEATQVSPSYVYAHAWLRWFRKAQRFREAVLWMDCCMNYQQSIPVNEVLMRAQVGTGVPGPAFVALAAQTKSALEQPMPDGQVHGVFTWTLLKGLRGGASDERGRITGESLRTFVYNVMPEFLPEKVKQSSAVDVQPFVRADDGIVFQRLAARPKYAVHLEIPAGVVGQQLTVWTGSPHRVAVSEALTGGEWTGQLVRGLYVVEVSGAGLRQGFQVSGGGDVEVRVEQQGPAVIPSDGSDVFDLDVVAGPAASITVTDYRFDRIYDETGQLHGHEPPGVYKIRIELGRGISTLSESVILLDRSRPPASPPPPPLASPAPIRGSAMAHEYHSDVFSAAAEGTGGFSTPAPGGAAISVISRYWTDPGQQTPRGMPHPMAGLSIVAASPPPAGELVVGDLSVQPQVDRGDAADPVAAWERRLAPGLYLLRQSLPNGQVFEATVPASAGWITQIALRLRGAEPDGAPSLMSSQTIDDAAVFMRRGAAAAGEGDQDAVIETARLALNQGRNLFGEGRGEDLKQLLLLKCDDPIAGIIGGHLLLRAIDSTPEPDPAWSATFDTLVTRLRGLVGRQHPDVEALSLRCTDAQQRASAPFTLPPMFNSSWKLVTAASYQNPGLVPLPLWQQVHASTTIGSFFVWAADEATRAAHAAQLAGWIRTLNEDPTVPGAAGDSARRLQIPLAAATDLWQSQLAHA